jgi:hypothetical protein
MKIFKVLLQISLFDVFVGAQDITPFPVSPAYDSTYGCSYCIQAGWTYVMPDD